jgi:hypothetical protein
VSAPDPLSSYLVANTNRALGQDLRPQAAAMSQAFDHLASGEPLEVIARFAQTNATNFHVTDLELVSYKMIERDPACDYIASRIARSQLEVVFTFEGFDRFDLNQRQLTIGKRFPKRS